MPSGTGVQWAGVMTDDCSGPARRFHRRTDPWSGRLEGSDARTGLIRRFAGQQMRIYWGAYLGTRDEILVAGSLSKVLDEIVQARMAAKKRFGWIMDTYLMVRET